MVKVITDYNNTIIVYNFFNFNNIVLKDGLLTLDFTNNKIYQKEIESEYSSAEEKEFNEFCNTQLKTVIA